MSYLRRAVETSRKVRERTREAYLRAVDAFETSGMPHSAAGLEAWRDQVAARTSAGTANAYLAAVKFASRRAAQLGLGPDFAAPAEALPTRASAKRAALEHADMRRLVAACGGRGPRDVRDRALIILALRTGMRRESVLSVEFASITSSWVEVEIKGGRRHRVPLDDETRAALGDWIGWLRKHGVRSGPVFRAVRGPDLHGSYLVSSVAMTPCAVNQLVARRARAAGLRGVHPHLFRHSFISWQIADGATDRDIMAVTGHRNPSTLTTYHTDLHEEPIARSIPPLR